MQIILLFLYQMYTESTEGMVYRYNVVAFFLNICITDWPSACTSFMFFCFTFLKVYIMLMICDALYD